MRETWTLSLQFFVKECIIDEEEENRSDRVGTYRVEKGGEIGWLLEMQYLESDSSNLEIYSVTNRKPMQISKNRCNAAKARNLGNNPSKSSILNKL